MEGHVYSNIQMEPENRDRKNHIVDMNLNLYDAIRDLMVRIIQLVLIVRNCYHVLLLLSY